MPSAARLVRCVLWRAIPVLTLVAPAIAAAQARVSVDRASDPRVARCLASAQGVIDRFTDTEAFAATDPRDPNLVIATWQTMSGAGAVIQFARSPDGGRTWAQPRAVPINACAGGPVPGAVRASDPWVSIGADGRVHLSAIAWTPDPADGPDLVSALVTVASGDGGRTWEAPVAAAIAPSRSIAHDNLAVTADPTRPGTVYLATTRESRPAAGTYHGQLGFTRSTDGGRTWEPMRTISPEVAYERIGAPQVVVDPRSGRLHAVYRRSRRGSPAVVGTMSSDDAGTTWSAERVVAPHASARAVVHPVTGREFALATDIVQGAVSPVTGDLVIAFAHARDDSTGRSDVSVARSLPGGGWSPPLRISEPGRSHAWLPAVTATPTGDFVVAFVTGEFGDSTSRAPLRVVSRRVTLRGTGVEVGASQVLDGADLGWPGDYMGIVAPRRGTLVVYGRNGDIFAVPAAGAARAGDP